MRRGGAVMISLLVLLAGCSTVRHTAPPRTATEQLLISAAADDAIRRLVVGLPPGTRVYVNEDTFKAYDQEYAIGAIRDRILRSGARLANSRLDADVILDLRSGALSVDESEMLIGLPGFEVPIPLAGSFKLPEIALFKRERQQGIAKFALTAYDAKSGALRVSSGPVFGFSHRDKYVVLLLLSWTSDDLIPPNAAR